MEVIIQNTREEAVSLTAMIVERTLQENPALVLGLATGRTMELVYQLLVEAHQQDALDFSLAKTFNLDEYVGVSEDDPRSYRYYMNKHLFHGVNIDLRNTHLPNGMAGDLIDECQRYEQKITAHNGIDLQLLGIGKTGHIGFNEPLSAMYSRTREKALTPGTLQQNAALVGGLDKMPHRAITMGVGTILECKRCVLLATGESKADVIAKAVEGPITSMISATALQLHPRCTVIVDEAAAAKLTQQDYYRWIFENEPEWREYR